MAGVASGVLIRGLDEVAFAHDVVALEHRARLVPGQLHGNALGNTGAHGLRTAVRRRSCGIRPAQPAFLQAALNGLMKVVIRLPFRLRFDPLNTQGQITPLVFSSR